MKNFPGIPNLGIAIVLFVVYFKVGAHSSHTENTITIVLAIANLLAAFVPLIPRK